MRLFAALPVEPPADGELAELLVALGAAGWPVRWARAEGLHIPLKFFGETDASRVEGVGAEAIDGLGREGHDLAGAQQRHRLGDPIGVRGEHPRHGAVLSHPGL